MSFLIKGIDKPKNSRECPFAVMAEDWEKECIAGGRYEWNPDRVCEGCPLVEVPTPHGRLIDEDNVIDLLREQLTGDRDTVYEYYDDGLEMAISELSIMPTIIEAEGETHEHTH